MVSYKELLRTASLDQKLALCSLEMQPMLEALRAGHDIKEVELHGVLDEAIDLPQSVRAESSLMVLFDLIAKVAAIGQLAGVLNAGNSRELMLARALEAPDKVLKFLAFSSDISIVNATLHQRKIVKPKFGLRHYQREVAKEIIGRLLTEDRLLLHAPTGAGKTRTMMSVASMHLRLRGPTTVLWLASTSELVSQAAHAFTEAWEAHGDIDAALVEWRAGNSFDIENSPERNTMLAASLQFLALLTKREAGVMAELRQQISLIIFDEAHQSIAPTYKELVEGIMAHGQCKLLGITATPGRSEGDAETEALSKMYGKDKVSIPHPGHDNPISYLVAEGYLAKAHFQSHVFGCSKASQNEDSGGDYSLEILDGVGRDLRRNMEILDIVRAAINDGHKRIIVFAPSVFSAQCCRLLLKGQYQIQDSLAIAGKTPAHERYNAIKRFTGNSPDPHVIFNYGVLTTGFDAPKTSVVVVARPTKSLVLYSQMVGRALRGPESGGNENAYVHTLVDSSFGDFANVVETFSSWDRYW